MSVAITPAEIHAYDTLPPECRALLYYGLISLKTEIERTQQFDRLQEEEIKQFRKNIFDGITARLSILQDYEQEAPLSLIKHFAPAK